MKFLAAAGIAALLATTAFAQFTGPSPASWRWQQPLTTDNVPNGTPVIDGDTVIVNNQQRVYAISASSGGQIWRYPAGAPSSALFINSPAVGGGTVFSLGSNKLVYAIDEKTGNIKWTYASPSGFSGDPIYTPQAVLFALSDGSIMALKPSDGTPYYDTPLVINNGLNGQIAVSGGDLVCFNGTSQLLAINIATRRLDWHDDFTSVPPVPHPVVYKGNIYVGAGGYVAAISGSTGHLIWNYNLNQDIAFWPAVGMDSVAVATPDGSAYTFTLEGQITSVKNGRPFPVPLGSFPQSAPTVTAPSTFAFPTSNGSIVLVKGGDDAPIWNYQVRPIGGVFEMNDKSKNGGLGSGSGLIGGKRGGGAGSPGGNINQNKTQDVTKVSSVQAAAPAVVSGTTLLQWCRDGSLIAFDAKSGVDVTPPTVDMRFPNPGSTVSGQPPLVLVFDIQDYSSGVDPSKLSISIDGKSADYTYTTDGQAIIHFSVGGKNPPLQDGRHTISVTSSDWMGNTGTTSFLLNIDNTLPPIQVQGQDQNGKNGAGAGAPGGTGGSSS